MPLNIMCQKFYPSLSVLTHALQKVCPSAYKKTHSLWLVYIVLEYPFYASLFKSLLAISLSSFLSFLSLSPSIYLDLPLDQNISRLTT